MAAEKYKLKPLSDVSFDIKLKWTLGILAELLGITKKSLRNAFRIIQSPKLEAEILEKGKPVKRTFAYGFRRFILTRKEKEREILAPHPEVQTVFTAIKNWLEKISQPHQNAFGCIKNRNPKKAAQALLGNKHFFGFDISDAFPSITAEMIKVSLRRLKVDEAIIEILTWLVTYYYQHERRLPQGASSSPIILNLVYRPLCDEVAAVCQKYNIEWNVYVDDFNFAAQKNIPPEAKAELLAVPAKYGFSLKAEKTRDNYGKTIPHILGLTIVDNKIHIKRRLKNKFRRIMYAARMGVYSSEQVLGIRAYIRDIYGDQENWPGWLLKPYDRYQAERGYNELSRFFDAKAVASKS